MTNYLVGWLGALVGACLDPGLVFLGLFVAAAAVKYQRFRLPYLVGLGVIGSFVLLLTQPRHWFMLPLYAISLFLWSTLARYLIAFVDRQSSPARDPSEAGL